ncbi:S-layer homology domain-containing protein, partial [Lentibacillus lipolyticus]
MSNKKIYRNIAVSSLAATAAVAVVAPAVSADSVVKFTDVQEGDSHYEGIMALAEQGIVAGYEDGSFGVYDNVTRQQVAVMLANALNLDTPADVDSVLSVYDDVDA